MSSHARQSRLVSPVPADSCHTLALCGPWWVVRKEVASVENPFDACWRRFDRAEEHRKAAAAVWNDHIDDIPHHLYLDDRGGGSFVIGVREVIPTPPAMSVLLGEWLYNLRCALDYAVYAAAVWNTGENPPPKQAQLQFPCSFDKSHYRDNEYRLAPLTEYQRTELIEFMQPFRHPDPDTSALGWLHRLARIDRHRRLTVMTGYLAESNPMIGVPDGCAVELEFGDRVLVDGTAELARFTVSPWEPSWEVRVDPRTGLDPEIAEWSASPFWRRIAYNERVRMLRVAVLSVVAPLEYDCMGYSREEDFLTAEFKAESDAHRPARPWAPTRTGLTW